MPAIDTTSAALVLACRDNFESFCRVMKDDWESAPIHQALCSDLQEVDAGTIQNLGSYAMNDSRQFFLDAALLQMLPSFPIRERPQAGAVALSVQVEPLQVLVYRVAITSA